jgi:hypothetical protein
MDEQVPVFLYSIPRNSSFTLSSWPGMAFKRPESMLKHPFSCRNALSSRRYHFCVLKNE